MPVWLCGGLMTGLLTAAEPPQALFRGDGEPATYADLLAAALTTEVVLFGEQHDGAAAHLLEQRLASELLKLRPEQVKLGAEMLETDNQLVVDEFLAGLIREKDLLSNARVWPNHAKDYQPLLNLAQETKTPFIATNIPRRYAALVSRDGLDALNRLGTEAKLYFPPLPIEVDLSLPGYQGLMEMARGHEHMRFHPEYLAQAQAVKDATMAWSILRTRQPGDIFLHIHGTYHSEHHEGVVWYLHRAQPGLKLLTIATVRQATLDALDEESKDLADFVLVEPEKETEKPSGAAA